MITNMLTCLVISDLPTGFNIGLLNIFPIGYIVLE